jgi:hypothetical protein
MNKLKQISVLLACIILIFLCKVNNKIKPKTTADEPQQFDDSNYVLNSKFSFGDARMFKVTADSAKSLHPYSKKTRFETAPDIAVLSG